MLVVIVYDISTAEAGGQKRLRKVARLDEYRNIRSPLPTVQAIREDEETRAAEAKPMSEDEMRAALLAKFGSKYKK